MAGQVLVDDEPADKPGARVHPESSVRLRGAARRYVSRGGEKLAGALADLALDVRGCRCLDVGASTGGFSDCLLQAGAAEVIALDVGYGQLALSLREDARVHVIERCNVRELAAGTLPYVPDFVCVDVSFISLRLVLPRLAALAPRAPVLVLVKPQFEVGREQVGKGGVVRDDALRAQAVREVAGCAAELGYRVAGQADSRLAGPKGNREVFLHLLPGAADPGGAPVDAARSRRKLRRIRTQEYSMALLEVTQPAAQRIKELLEKDGKLATHGLRLKVVGGGCSGLRYELAFDDRIGERDHELEVGGVRVIVDEKSALYLSGTTLDFVDTLQESGSRCRTRTSSTTTCGCGESFNA